MASAHSSLMSLAFLFYRGGDPIHIVMEQHSYTFVCHPETACWYCWSERYLDGDDISERNYEYGTTIMTESNWRSRWQALQAIDLINR